MVSRITLLIFLHTLHQAHNLRSKSSQALSLRVDLRPNGLINGGSADELHRFAP